MDAKAVDAAFDVENLLEETETALGRLEELTADGTALADAVDVARERLTGLRRVVRESRERDGRKVRPSWMPEVSHA
jgi:hypothetical protein